MPGDIFSIPISVISKSVFSVGARILDQCQSAIKSENVDALICIQNWLFGKTG